MGIYANNDARRKGFIQGLRDGTLRKRVRAPITREVAAEILSQVSRPGGPSYAQLANETNVPKTMLRTGVNRLRAEMGKKHRAVSRPRGKQTDAPAMSFDNLQLSAGASRRGRRGRRKAA